MSSVDRRECEWVSDRIDAFIDGADSELSDADRRRVAGHLESCDACARELALLEYVRDGLRGMDFSSAPESVVERAALSLQAPTNVVRLHPRRRPRPARWVPAAVAAALLVAAVFLESDRRSRQAASSPEAIATAARDAALAFAYVNKYARRTGAIVEDEVIKQRLVAPMEKAMEKSGVAETKPEPGQS